MSGQMSQNVLPKIENLRIPNCNLCGIEVADARRRHKIKGEVFIQVSDILGGENVNPDGVICEGCHRTVIKYTEWQGKANCLKRKIQETFASAKKVQGRKRQLPTDVVDVKLSCKASRAQTAPSPLFIPIQPLPLALSTVCPATQPAAAPLPTLDILAEQAIPCKVEVRSEFPLL